MAEPLLCAQPHCGQPLVIRGVNVTHDLGDGETARHCPILPKETAALVATVDVVHRHHDASESWHVVVDRIEYAVYLNGCSGMYCAWRVGYPSDEDGQTVTAGPWCAIYDPEPQRDAEVLLAQMPPLAAFWLRDAIFPF